MLTALIIGVASQDGSYLAEFLLSKGYKVIGTTRNTSGDSLENIPFLKSKIIHETANLLDFASISGLVKNYQPDEFYNLAALTVPQESWQQAYLVGQVTGLGPVLGLEAIRQFSPRTKFFQASSREIFNPKNPYAAAKAYAHSMVNIYRESNGLFACSGILFNHESPRRPVSFVTRKITQAAALKKHLVLWNLDSQRDWGFAGDYVSAMWQMLQPKVPKDYIIATNSLHSVRDICKIAYSRVGLRWTDYVTVDPAAKPKSDPVGQKGDYSQIKNDLGWEPKTSFKELIEMMVDSDLTS